MRRFAGACRFVFNRALALQNENHEAENKYLPYTKMASWLIEWKANPETQWLKEAPSQPLQQSLKDLERATRISSRSAPHSRASKNAGKTMHSATRKG
ncbi:Helix-turn-helix domain [Serratia plymuthica]|uniref:Helix-turn-helix domain n=1 Tax=Serratia plymuthica TaxID=82996 RepID=A0A2X4UWP1_SERPL|nr:Helix-turn-helix domain [Serratia plymuthica]